MSKLQKHAREVLAKVQAMGVDAVEIDASPRNGHYRLIVTKNQVSIQTSVSGSPSDERNCVNATVQAVRRQFLARGVQLSR